jgi:hypothetical protein
MLGKKALFMTLAFGLLAPLNANSSSLVTKDAEKGTTWWVQNVATWQTTGNLMDNISIKATFSDGSHETLLWADSVGVLSSKGWSLTMSDYGANTFSMSTEWIFSNTSSDLFITNLTIDGKSGDTVFDILDLWNSDGSSNEVTPSSARGRSIGAIGFTTDDLTVTATYSNEVAVIGSGGALGDLFHTLSLDFSHLNGNGFGQETFRFYADTDNVNYNPVPEPTTMLMFGLGLAGLASIRARRKK